MSPAFRSIATATACAAALAACGRHEAKSGASSADSHAPGTTLAAIPGACTSYTPGTPGVVSAVCGGSAVVKIAVGGKAYALKGGACSASNHLFALNLGVKATRQLGGPRPDHFALKAPVGAGPFTNATLALTVDGKTYAAANASGDVSAQTFEATTADGTRLTGSFTC